MSNNYTTFFDKLPDKITHGSSEYLPPKEDEIIWVDNTSAVSIAKSEDSRPRSRHYALRYMRVKDRSGDICYCPTTLQKADALTKVNVSKSQRDLLLHHTIPDLEKTAHESDDDVVEEQAYMSYGFMITGDKLWQCG